jgi:exonuclease III
MKILSWNCRGLGDPRTVQELIRLVCTHQPKIVFLSETRQNKKVIEELRWRIGLKHFVSFHEEGKGGGLALFWHESVDVELFKINSRVIDVLVHGCPNEIKWRCTFVYGEPRRHLRHLMWELLRKMKPMIQGPWLMLGDFNEALWQAEHFSERSRGEKQMLEFRETLSFCNLHDLGF